VTKRQNFIYGFQLPRAAQTLVDASPVAKIFA